MRFPLVALVMGLGLAAATPALACMSHDQQAASDAQQQTAQAQAPAQTSTQ